VSDGESHLAAARSWLAQDPDGQTRDELRALIESAERGDHEASAALADRFGARLAFGTAGLRGELGAGSNRMNRVLVAQAAAGLAAYLLDRAEADAAAPTVVVGYDGRRNSDVFARDSVEVFAGAGLRAILLPRMLPTPVLAYAVRALGADAGVMVTASHNPPNDNGYKVYLGGADRGSQIVVLRDPPRAADDTTTCLEHNEANPEMCERPAGDALRDDDYVEIAQSVDGVDVIDLTDVFCWDGTCKTAIGGVTVYRDSHHISVTFSITLAPLIGAELDRLGLP